MDIDTNLSLEGVMALSTPESIYIAKFIFLHLREGGVSEKIRISGAELDRPFSVEGTKIATAPSNGRILKLRGLVPGIVDITDVGRVIQDVWDRGQVFYMEVEGHLIEWRVKPSPFIPYKNTLFWDNGEA